MLAGTTPVSEFHNILQLNSIQANKPRSTAGPTWSMQNTDICTYMYISIRI